MNYIYGMELDTINIEGWMTVAEYAVKCDISVQAVYKRIRKGSLHARKLKGLILVGKK